MSDVNSSELTRVLDKNSANETAPSEATLVNNNIKIITLLMSTTHILKLTYNKNNERNSNIKSSNITCFLSPINPKRDK